MNNNKQFPGLFITFEGCEGCGKTTQSKKLHKYLSSKGQKTLWTREVGGTIAAEKMREILIHEELSPKAETLLIMSARAEHIEKVIYPALKNGEIVICDRFLDSTVAYQGSNSSLSKEDILFWHQEILSNFLPDITFFMDLSPEQSLKRAIKRGDVNKFEAKPASYHQNAYQTFSELCHNFPERIIRINASESEDIIHQNIILHLKKFNQ